MSKPKLDPTLFQLLQHYYQLVRIEERTQQQEDDLSAIRKLSKRDYELAVYLRAIDKYFTYVVD